MIVVIVVRPKEVVGLVVIKSYLRTLLVFQGESQFSLSSRFSRNICTCSVIVQNEVTMAKRDETGIVG